MKYYTLAIIIGIISIMCTTASYSYYRLAQNQENFYENKYHTIIKMKSERKQYGEKLEALKEHARKLIAISKERKTTVDYDITLYDHDIDALYTKLVSTYNEGLFFLESATISSGSPGIRLAVRGFKMGEDIRED